MSLDAASAVYSLGPAAMMKLFGQLLVPPALSVLALNVFFGDWWDSVGMRSRWSVWILLSAGLLLFFHLAWSTYERRRLRKRAAARPSSAPILIKKAPAPLKKVSIPPKPTAHAHPADDTEMTTHEEQWVLEAARRTLSGECLRVELYRDRGRLVVREVRFKVDETRSR